MPLTRYQIRNEDSLANPDLYRVAAKDDPEGLLEGVAMAALVGMVRQLGDLAEFAAEVFHDLHEEVLATAARGHELLIRVQQLEAELPVVEKIMFAETNYVNYAYTPGVEWHASIRNDQNHFTQGDLPRFIRTAYEDCRGPPRLSELDKFDVAGDGACLKRYTDPSFFKMEWASSELMKAEREQLDKKARRIKKKARRYAGEAISAMHMQPRLHHTLWEAENIASTSVKSSLLKPHHSPRHGDLGLPLHRSENQQASTKLMVPEEEVLERKQGSLRVPAQETANFKGSEKLPSHDSGPVELTQEPLDLNYKPSKHTCVTTEVVNISSHSSDVESQKEGLCMSLKASEDLADELASEADNFMDALTTMDSEVDTDLEVKTTAEADLDFGPEVREEDATLQPEESHLKNSGKDDLATQDDVTRTHEKADISGRVEPVHVAGCPQMDPMEDEHGDGRGTSASVQGSASGTPINWSATSSPVVVQSVAVKSEEFTESESVQEVPETPDTPEAKESNDFWMEDLEGALHQFPEPAIQVADGVQGSIPDHLGSLPFISETQANVLPTKQLFAELDISENSDSEHGECIKESSPHSSSANSSIQPVNWARDFSCFPNNVVDSDDELDGMQVSSTSPSSHSSALSSPRPSTLATTILNMDFDKEPRSLPSPHGSIRSSPESIRSQSAGSSRPPSPVSLMETADKFNIMSPPPVNTSSRMSLSSQLSALELFHQASSTEDQIKGHLVDGFEHFPPPPPLPPIEWRMTKRTNAISPAPADSFKWSREASGIKSFAPQSIYVQPDEPLLACKPSSTTDHGSENLSLLFRDAQQTTGASSATDNVPVIIEGISEDSKSLPREPMKPSTTAPEELVQPLKAFRLGFPMPPNFPVVPGDLVKTSEPDMRSYSTVGVPAVKYSEPPLPSIDAAGEADYNDDDNDEESSHACFSLLDSHLHAESLDFSPSQSQGGKPAATLSSNIPADGEDKFCNDDPSLPITTERINPLSKEDEKSSVKSIPSPPQKPDSVQVPTPFVHSKIERRDPLIAALVSHDKSMLKKVPEWSQSSRSAPSDDREVLLEQIRTGSFSLRHTKIEKQEPPRPVASINVAAILEKANAIRQAFAGSDDDDEDDDNWSD